MDPLPDPKLPPGELQALRKVYADLVGFVPPRIAARTDLMSRLDPEGLRCKNRSAATSCTHAVSTPRRHS